MHFLVIIFIKKEKAHVRSLTPFFLYLFVKHKKLVLSLLSSLFLRKCLCLKASRRRVLAKHKDNTLKRWRRTYGVYVHIQLIYYHFCLHKNHSTHAFQIYIYIIFVYFLIFIISACILPSVPLLRLSNPHLPNPTSLRCHRRRFVPHRP